MVDKSKFYLRDKILRPQYAGRQISNSIPKQLLLYLSLIIVIFLKNVESQELKVKVNQNLAWSRNNSSSSDVIIIQILQHNLELSINEVKNISYTVSGSVKRDGTVLNLELNSTDYGILDSLNNISVVVPKKTVENQFMINSKLNGYTLLTLNATPENMTDHAIEFDVSKAFVRISVHYSPSLDYISDIVGWTYFVAWSISFYPQIWLNWKRKSVIGLHFDFLSLNVIGFFVYGIFNFGLYFVPMIEKEYFARHPYGVNPVQLNDVIFAIHAFFACVIQVIQCIIYERGDQKISKTGRSLLGTFVIASFIMFILGCTSVVEWLDFLYFLSYIKLFITLIKYIPQAYYNYLRKSTSGWSIGNIILDFAGGSLSICQMFILAFNYNDWGSIFGDLSKFGLGFFSILFDIFFIVQHYILYKSQENYSPLIESPIITSSNSADFQPQASYGSTTDKD